MIKDNKLMGIKAEINYPSGVKTMWIYNDDKDKLVCELLKLDYKLYKQQVGAEYSYMGYEIHINDDYTFEKNLVSVGFRMNRIERMVDKLI